MGAATCTPGALQPQDLAAGHAPRRLAEAPAGLPRRIRVPPQPPPHTPRQLPDAAWPRRRSRAHHLPPDHPQAAAKPLRGADRISMTSSIGAPLILDWVLASRRPAPPGDEARSVKP